ncbi:hypothetical protein CIG66_07145 [Ralstonia pseudosolanacearum]|uniref:ERF family protein n=1 Tax=Ralstonia pseudosolanacearum TaxID=1310165 RepID=UPI000B9A08CA|nr:hypothetical protein CIG66_07145 [Ralstonia pseudosolanacearum]
MSEKNIHQRMLDVMRAVGYVQKEDKKVNGQYTFVSHDAVKAKIRPALIENGILPIPTIKSHTQDGNRTEADVVVKFVNVDKPDDFIEIELFGYGIDPQDKGPGKAMSYAVKYAFLNGFCLETGDDPERDNIPHEPGEKVEPEAKPAKRGMPMNEYADWITKINDAAEISIDELRAVTKDAVDASKKYGDVAAMNKLRSHGTVKAQKFEGAVA